ncbi:MAG: pyridoxamine 5'-phosphate oxidase family protein [Rhodospirillaceae bacterium]|nr:pyridoxamine 5'-phosphate oxidase family protein [Rhodospirillales bacterium]
MTTLPKTPRSTTRRKGDRASHDAAAIHAVLDEALVVHVGFIQDGQPFVIPTNGWRVGEHLYFHFATGSRIAQMMGAACELCVTATLLDGLVLARSAMHHSMNFRSVMLFGQPEAVQDPDEKGRVLAALVEKVTPDRASRVRPADQKELAVTAVFRLPIAEGSLKARSGPPQDRPDDLTRPVSAGVVPLRLVAGDLIPA